MGTILKFGEEYKWDEYILYKNNNNKDKQIKNELNGIIIFHNNKILFDIPINLLPNKFTIAINYNISNKIETIKKENLAEFNEPIFLLKDRKKDNLDLYIDKYIIDIQFKESKIEMMPYQYGYFKVENIYSFLSDFETRKRTKYSEIKQMIELLPSSQQTKELIKKKEDINKKLEFLFIQSHYSMNDIKTEINKLEELYQERLNEYKNLEEKILRIWNKNYTFQENFQKIQKDNNDIIILD